MEIKVPSERELYETIVSRSSRPLPGFEELNDRYHRFKASKLHDYLSDRADRMDVPCILCRDKSARRSCTRYVYETPWDEIETEMPFCSEDCETAYLYTGDFQYFWCEPCGREICEQNPKNGWHIQYRDYDGETVCLRCYKDLILENGIEREKLEAGKIPGMFFNHGNPEPQEAGYAEIPEFSSFPIKSEAMADIFIRKALDLMDQGSRVVVGYERMAIDGSEGFVTLLVKD
jgi:endogenous inhibitor of DNA gyrase (YacG/DUF329 family)